MRKIAYAAGVAILAGLAALFLLRPSSAPAEGIGKEKIADAPGLRAPDAAGKAKKAKDGRVSARAAGADRAAAAPRAEARRDVPAAEREDEEERLVDAFDAETDRWISSEKTKPPTMAEVENFRALFKALPKARKDECLHRALNLVPDANVMLLVGILMDKTADPEYVRSVYNDVLNREESVKKPILLEIFKDRTHACWADTAWILDVTGATPKKK